MSSLLSSLYKMWPVYWAVYLKCDQFTVIRFCVLSVHQNGYLIIPLLHYRYILRCRYITSGNSSYGRTSSHSLCDLHLFTYVKEMELGCSEWSWQVTNPIKYGIFRCHIIKHTANHQNTMYAGYHETKQYIFAIFVNIYIDTPVFNQ